MSEMSGCHWARSRFMSASCFAAAPPATPMDGSRARRTTTSSSTHGTKPRVKTFLWPVR